MTTRSRTAPLLLAALLMVLAGTATTLRLVSSDVAAPGSDRSPRTAASRGDGADAGSAAPEGGAAEPDGTTEVRRLGRADLTTIEARMDRVSRRIAGLEEVARDLRVWFGCVHLLPVSQVGDPQHQWGFRYDEGDGTGVDTRPALVLHTGPTRADMVMLRVSRRPECLSAAPDPRGTGNDARVVAGRSATSTGPIRPQALRALERRLERLEGRINQLDRSFDRFDEWEACLSWLPVTELGDDYQDLGYLFRPLDSDGSSPVHLPAIDVDATEWDDPDYELLVFLGRDRPFTHRECGHEPGEGVDRVAPGPFARGGPRLRRATGGDRVDDLRRELRGTAEDVEDLVEPSEEFTQFDECMFVIGLQERGGRDHGYHFEGRDGRLRFRAALSYDLGGLELPQLDVMAFPGEEPPQIECNEDAGGQGTDE